MPTPDLMLRRQASLGARSLDREARTVEAVLSTGAPVQRHDFDGPYVEVLSLEAGHVDLSRLVGGPVLDAHRSDSLDRVHGTVRRAWVAEGGLRALIFVRNGPRGDALLQDLGEGVIRHLSVGYSVERWEDSTDASTGARTRKAVRWTPVEASFVPLPADPGATVRMRGEAVMETEITAAAPAAAAAAPAAQPGEVRTRAQVNAEIRGIANTAGLERDFADGLIDRGASVEEARSAAFDALVRRAGGTIETTQPRVEIGASHEDPEIRCRHMGEALYARIAPGHELSAPARPYAGLSLAELAREGLRLRGVPTLGLSGAEIITRSLHTTSDFAIILGDTVGRSLRAAYQSAPEGVRQLGRRTTARDFRAKHRIMLGEAPTLERVNEHGEFKSGTMAEAKESYWIDTFGRIFGITRQALVNDDLGAFTDLSRRLGIAAAEFEAQFLVDLLTGAAGLGPLMDDGERLFDASHGNVADSGAAPAEETLSAARLAMRRQTGLSGRRISVVPRTLLVPAELETKAEKLLTQIQAAKTDDVNPFSGLGLVVEPRLPSATRWYLQADNVDGLEYAHLEGAEGPQIESRNGFEIDGVQIRVRLDFGAGFVDWRGWYTNAGA